MTRFAAVVSLCLIAFPANAHPSCSEIKAAVAKYGAWSVKAWARAKGIPEKTIQELERKCLK